MKKSSSLKKPSRGHLLYKDERIESKEIVEVERLSAEVNGSNGSVPDNAKTSSSDINDDDESEFWKRMSMSADEYSTIQQHIIPRSNKTQHQSPNKEQSSSIVSNGKIYSSRSKASMDEDDNKKQSSLSKPSERVGNVTTSPENRDDLGRDPYRNYARGSDEIDAKLSVIRERVMRRLSPARISDRNESSHSTSSSPTRDNHSPSVSLRNNRGIQSNSQNNDATFEFQNDVEKQRLRYMVIKLQKEYQNTRIRERRATKLARSLSELITKHQNYVNNLKKKYVEKEREVVDLKDTIEELNGALQRCQMTAQSQNSTKSLIEKISTNFDSILEAINSKTELMQIIDAQKEEISQNMLTIKKLFNPLQQPSREE
ncbi:hypothetical protein C9374_014474 [Naegleria lovaniensis]|uniref:Uncharacterized protein n=1 Tax=Naegleria lovaniensis TaxID=51637 RepID=A0AA88H0J4_NAELO|nr:uncharacterized protein C9374_014474 [Naegleria lovaniensis]KAG2389074.1 hypothetical protein C9374_014474 [Naegleria lovaniensis]